MVSLINANDRKALEGTVPGKQLHLGRVQDEGPGVCENLLGEQQEEASQAKAQVHAGTDGAAGNATDGDVLDIVDSSRHGSLLPCHPAEARGSPQESSKELEAAATLADIIQGLGLQYFCREGNLDGLSVQVRTLRGVVARHLDVDLRRGLPGSYQKRLFGLAGAASTPWGRAIRSSPQLKGVLSQDWALLFPPDYHL
eukprot:gene1993-2678_t